MVNGIVLIMISIISTFHLFTYPQEQKCLDEGGWTNYGISDKN